MLHDAASFGSAGRLFRVPRVSGCIHINAEFSMLKSQCVHVCVFSVHIFKISVQIFMHTNIVWRSIYIFKRVRIVSCFSIFLVHTFILNCKFTKQLPIVSSVHVHHTHCMRAHYSSSFPPINFPRDEMTCMNMEKSRGLRDRQVIWR